MNGRTRAVAVIAAAAMALGLVAWLRWPSSRPALDCAPSEVHLGADGVARCGPGAELPAGHKLTVGAPLDLNRATEADLALLPGVGPALAKAIVDERARLGGFKGWDQLDQVPGIGPSKLQTLKATAEIR
jgi:competence protein ComEA